MTRIAVALMFLLTILPTTVISSANVARHRPSPKPECFVCPDDDGLDRHLTSHTDGTGAKTLTCYYNAGTRMTLDHSCSYNAFGIITGSEGDIACPLIADIVPCAGTAKRSKRANIVETVKRRAEARAAQPQASRPNFMGLRNDLGRKRKAMQEAIAKGKHR